MVFLSMAALSILRWPAFKLHFDGAPVKAALIDRYGSNEVVRVGDLAVPTMGERDGKLKQAEAVAGVVVHRIRTRGFGMIRVAERTPTAGI